MKRSFAVTMLTLLACVPASAAGLSVNVPVVGRVVGGGGVLFLTSIDVTNNSSTPVGVDFYFAGTVNGTEVFAEGTVGDFGVVSRGRGTMTARSNQHFDDFAQALVDAGLLSPSSRDGVLGSVLFVFNGSTKRGQGAVAARFYNAFSGGNVAVALKGHEIAVNEPTKLIATLRDTTNGNPSGALYPNLFINNTGLAPDGSIASGPVTVQLSAVSGRTGNAVGNPVTITIDPGQTASVGHAFQVLGVDISQENTIIVTAAVTSGNAAIEGLVSQVDNVTKDGAAFEMSRADF